jgi:hypothetical protein
MPLFETAQHREVEERIICTAAKAFKCEAAPCSKAYCVDAVLFRNGRAVAFAEARQRKDKDGELLSIHKYNTLTWNFPGTPHSKNCPWAPGPMGTGLSRDCTCD